MVDFERARKVMLDNQIRPSGVTDRRVLKTLGRIPRENFVPESRRELAYIDDVHQLNTGGVPRLLSSPAPFAKLIQLADIGERDKVLDLPCGSGYSTAVLADLAGEVIGLESEDDLARMATDNLSALGIGNARVLRGDIGQGAAAEGPFDVIVLEGAVEAVPEALFAQLKDGGRLVTLLRQGAVAVAHLYVRSGESVASRAEFNASLPPIEISKRPEQFVF